MKLRLKRSLYIAVIMVVLICGWPWFSSVLTNESAYTYAHNEDINEFELPTGGAWQEPEPELREYDGEDVPRATRAYYTSLSEAGAYLANCMKNRQTEVMVNHSPSLDWYDILDEAKKHTRDSKKGDYLRQYRYVSGYEIPLIGSKYEFTYATTLAEEDVVDRELAKIYDELGIKNMKTDLEKFKAVYKWIVTNVSYDYEGLELEQSTGNTYNQIRTAYAALTKRKVVCGGYAILVYRMMLDVGIDCRYIVSQPGPYAASNHAWNIVKIEGKWYCVDATWDAAYLQAGSFECFRYMLLSKADLGNQHPWDGDYATASFNNSYPVSANSYFRSLGFHVWGAYEMVEDSTCSKEGTSQRLCEKCDDVNYSSIAKKAHQCAGSGTITTAPTCTKTGVETCACDNCGTSFQRSVAKLPHEYERQTIEEATCTSTGVAKDICRNCNHNGSTTTIEKKPHNSNDGVVKTPVTCTSSGTVWYNCRDCNAFIRSETIQKLGHIYDEGTVTREPTCTMNGILQCTCERCQKTEDVTIPKLGHSYDTVEYHSSTHHKRVCSHDSNHYELIAHDWQHLWNTKLPNCEESGESKYCCEACKTYKIEDIPATGHDFDEWVKVDEHTHQHVCKHDDSHVETEAHSMKGDVLIKATKDAVGLIVYRCTSCTHKKYETLPRIEESEQENILAGEAEEMIASMDDDDDPAGSTYGLLQLKSAKVTKNSVKISWKKVAGAKQYVIYGNACGKKNKMKKLATLESSEKAKDFKTVAGKKVKKGTYYKFVVVAIDKSNKVISISKTIHVATKGGKVTNAKRLTLKKGKTAVSKLTVNKGKTVTIKSTEVKESKTLTLKKHRAVLYESSDPKIATVGAKTGKIKGIKKGSCYIYAYAQNGAAKKILIKVD